ncbi:hypothetical protein CALVIDRAFT_490265 [Calocera viscosa TUFC12733]|uniref:CxC5 like cysteine cluster associated with KDZ domain-containing protein n=1 Tax=Calocera viscosa (strain TUFC12733) TaxID=1330018 RepID=A0A167GHS5_CALVF|nr:hypothetical protein CALVIDRAFT_490265 [Calocera viscosa TUFC12733]
MLIAELVQHLWAHLLVLGNVPVDILWNFLGLTTHFQPIIAWSAGLHLDRPVSLLPTTITAFLAQALVVHQDVIDVLWHILGPVIWQQGRFGHERTLPLVDPIGPIIQHGPSHNICVEEFFPPVRACTQDLCPTHGHLVDLQRHEAHYYTLDRGVIPVNVSSLRCRSCSTTYYLNYFRRKDPDGVERRHYYPGQPAVLHVETHILVDSAVSKLFKSQVLHAHASGQAMERIYMAAIARQPHGGHPIPDIPTLRRTYVWDTFYLDALLQHHEEQGTILTLPEHPTGSRPWGAQRDRIREGLRQRNEFIAGTGQELYAHACDGCVRLIERNEQQFSIHAAVTDGVSIGRPCCAVHNCHESLPTITSRFCNTHEPLNHICAIRGCSQPVVPQHRTCDNPNHIQNFDHLYNLLKEADILCDGKQILGNNTLKAQLGRAWTHNEQLIVRPCGIIVARATFYGAEAISSVADMLRAVFSTRNSVPDILFYDNNCHLRRHLQTLQPNHFEHMGQPVDVFHFKAKHSEKDDYCGQHCNPLLFPDIYDAPSKTWFFNSSAAEQTNAWLNGYHSIVHDLDATCFDFFLDEMIKERNRFLLHTLQQQGKHPHLIPHDYLFSKSV